MCRFAADKAAAAAAKTAADKKSADAAAALKVKRVEAAMASAAKAAAQKAAARAVSAQATANVKAQMLGAPLKDANVVFDKALKSRTDSTSAASRKQGQKRRSTISSTSNEVKFYRGHECSMAVIFPDDAEFALACARVRKAQAA